MNGNGHKRRLEALETVLEPSADEAAQARWQAAWDAAVDALLATMSPEHVQAIAEEMQQREHPSPSSAAGRLWCEFHSRVGEKVGFVPGHPPRYPDAPLWLGAALADVYLRGAPHLSSAARCSACGLRLPTAGESVPIVCVGGAWAFRDTGEPAREPFPLAVEEERSQWRAITFFVACPLCGGEIVSVWATVPTPHG